MSQENQENGLYLSTDSKDNQNTTLELSLDLLSEKIKLLESKVPHSKQEFYRASFDIFSRLYNLVRSHTSQYLGTLEDSDIIHTITEYIDLTYDYKEASHVRPIWEICDILYLSGKDIATGLGNWLNEHDMIPSLEEQRANDSDEEYEEHNSIGPTWIWETARRQLFRGNFEEAINILNFALSFVSFDEASAIKTIIKLIQEFQEIRYQQDTTLYKEKWTAWHQHCVIRSIEYKDLSQTISLVNAKDDEIALLFGVLAGDEEILLKCGTFVESIVGIILFSRPQITAAGVNLLAQHVYNTVKLSDHIEQDDTSKACRFFLMGCFDDAFDTCANDIWLQTHLGYALIAAGVLNSEFDPITQADDNEQILDPIYYSIQQYANNITQEFGMWNEAVIYLSCCSSNNEIWIKHLLEPSLSSKDLEQLQSILDIATQYKLPQIQTYIHKAMGQFYERNQNIRQATIQYGKAGDVESLDRFAHQEFSQYARTGKLDNVVTDVKELFACPHYTILIRYTQFHENLKQKRWQEASTNVLSLIQHEKLPNRFEIVLLIDTLEILNEKQHYYASEELSELIRIFNQVTKDKSDQAFMSKYYKLLQKSELNPDIITAKIREKLAYKIAIAPSVI